MRRLSILTVCALALAAQPFGPDALAQDQAATKAGATPTDAGATGTDAGAAATNGAAPVPGETAPRETRPGPRKAGWWNMPQLIEALSLEPAQREKMDASLAASRQGAGEGRELFNSFHDALAKGDWKAARSDLEKLAQRSAAQTRAGGELKLQVLEALDEKQRALLVEKYPGLLRTQWGSGRAQGRGR